MSNKIIDEHTEEKIKDYLSEEKVKESHSAVSDNFGVEKNAVKTKNKKILFLVLFFVILAVIFSFSELRNKGKQSFDESRVSIVLEAPGIISSGNDAIFELRYKNETNVNLQKAKISFFVPKEFVFISSDKEAKVEETVITWNIDDIPAGASGSIKIFGKVYGTVGKEFDFNSKIVYYPDNFNYEFESSDSLSRTKVKIFSVPFELSVNLPEETMSGEQIELVLEFENKSELDFKTVGLELQFNQDFNLNASDPEPKKKEENLIVFQFENVKSKYKNKIVIQGSYENEQSEKKEIRIRLNAAMEGQETFDYIDSSKIIQVNEIPIEVKQFINGSEEYIAFQGEQLEYIIKFKNKGSSEIKGLVVKSKIEGEVDLESLEVSNGSYDKSSNIITWSAFNVPKLASFKPSDEGEVAFKIKIKDSIEVKKSDNKNYVINNNVKISNFNFSSESVNVEKTIVNSDNSVKLSALLFIRSKGYFNDDGRIKNAGAIPPEVDKETTYLIHWYLSSLLNDMKNLKISTILPEGVNWTGNYIKSDGKVSLGNEANGTITPLDEEEILIESIDTQVESDLLIADVNSEDVDEEEIIVEDFYYNTKTREIIWEIPVLGANTGIVSPAKEVVFQIRISPQESDIGNVIVLMSDVKAVGFDKFTQKEIITIESELTTELPDDYSIGIDEGAVVANSEKEEN
ncbi:hypothetical protein K0B03_01915 [Patescibacteria group bacterium]|nr:hypothetical protein [Patescibacteria group bacterium]